jgi:hypothetical protein
LGASLTLAPNTAYEVEMMLQPAFTTNSTSNITLSVVMASTATAAPTSYSVIYSNGTTATQSSTSGYTWMTGQTASTVVATITAIQTTYVNVFVKGILRTGSTGGTLSPQVQLSGTNTTAFSVAYNSYLKVTPIGSDASSSIGAWA